MGPPSRMCNFNLNIFSTFSFLPHLVSIFHMLKKQTNKISKNSVCVCVCVCVCVYKMMNQEQDHREMQIQETT